MINNSKVQLACYWWLSLCDEQFTAKVVLVSLGAGKASIIDKYERSLAG